MGLGSQPQELLGVGLFLGAAIEWFSYNCVSLLQGEIMGENLIGQFGPCAPWQVS